MGGVGQVFWGGDGGGGRGAEKGARECVLSTKTSAHNSHNTCFSYWN
ncbi:MAG: hypothetical protein ACKERG_03930 [Candidatus Hodgkinia cicadicola]